MIRACSNIFPTSRPPANASKSCELLYLTDQKQESRYYFVLPPGFFFTLALHCLFMQLNKICWNIGRGSVISLTSQCTKEYLGWPNHRFPKYNNNMKDMSRKITRWWLPAALGAHGVVPQHLFIHSFQYSSREGKPVSAIVSEAAYQGNGEKRKIKNL